MRPLPGERKSLSPDECGRRAARFVEAIYASDMVTAWAMLSRETRGLRQGIWGTRRGLDLQMVYRAAHDAAGPLFQVMMDELRQDILRKWPPLEPAALGVAPTRYVDNQHAFVFLPFGVTDDSVAVTDSLQRGIVIPMLLEDGEWKVDLPTWRFYWENRKGQVPPEAPDR